MKYIRTENEIYELATEEITEAVYEGDGSIYRFYVVWRDVGRNRYKKHVRVEDVSLTSGRLEDLCDHVFYKVRKGGIVDCKLTDSFPMDDLKAIMRESSDIEWVKLGILTDEGIIFKAEFHKDGFRLIRKGK